MSDAPNRWWMSGDGSWHEGDPPPGWSRATNNRWYPPTLGPEDPTAVSPQVRPEAPSTGEQAGAADPHRSWPRWARIAVPIAAVFLLLGAIGAIAGEPQEGTDQVAPEQSTTTVRPTTTTTRATTTGEPPATTTTAPLTTAATAPPRTVTPPTEPPPPPPPPEPAPPPPPPATGSVTPGALCSPAGATATSVNGAPMTCQTQKCNGTPYDQPRWRKTTC